MAGLKRRILGKEKILLIDGSEVVVDVYSVALTEKNQIERKCRTNLVIGTGIERSITTQYEDDRVVEEMLKIALQGQIDINDIDCSMDELYIKYFDPKRYVGNEKKSNTSEQ
jgi:hypothetical protein